MTVRVNFICNPKIFLRNHLDKDLLKQAFMKI